MWAREYGREYEQVRTAQLKYGDVVEVKDKRQVNRRTMREQQHLYPRII
jgi:hypothetical protein